MGCNPTMWRKLEAIPILERESVSFYNPQVEDWSPELLALEEAAKQNATVLLFVIDAETRALMSMLEATELIATGRQVVLTIRDVVPKQQFGEDVVGVTELKDLNRARGFLTDMAQRHGVPVHQTVEAAVHGAIAMARCEEPLVDKLGAEFDQLGGPKAMPTPERVA